MTDRTTLLQAAPGEYPVIPAAALEKTMSETVEPFLAKTGKAFSVEAQEGHRLCGMTFRAADPKGTVMISHGFSESWEKYREMIYYFLTEGYDVCIHNHWGHGDSGHTHPGGPTHIDRFQTYVDDMAAVAKAVLPELTAPYCLYAHSMGGLVGALFIQQHPGVFEKAVFNAPMFEINRGGVPYAAAKTAAAFLCLIGRGKAFLPGQMPYSTREDFEASASDCPERYRLYYRRQVENIRLRNGGASCRWALESFRAGERLLKKKNCARMKLPILLFQAERDDYVLPGGQERFIAAVSNGRIIFVPGVKHEIYMSGDAVMKHYLQAVMSFLNR